MNIARISDLLLAFFYFTSASRILDCAVFDHYHEGENTVKARSAMLQTCRLSRGIVWKVWKEAVEGIVVDEQKGDVYNGLGLYMAELVDAKEGLMAYMEGMIR